MTLGDDLIADIEADATEVLLSSESGFGFPALYKKQGGGVGVSVTVYISNRVHQAEGVEIGDRFTGPKRSQKDPSVPIMVHAMSRTDTVNADGIGTEAGGVATLAEGDILSNIPGHKIGRPETATLDLVVTGGISRTANGGHWVAEARP